MNTINFAERPFKASDGEQTITIWLSDDEIAKGNIRFQVISKAQAKGLKMPITVSIGY